MYGLKAVCEGFGNRQINDYRVDIESENLEGMKKLQQELLTDLQKRDRNSTVEIIEIRK